MTTDEKVVKRLQYLIEQAGILLQTKGATDGYGLNAVNVEKFVEWVTSCRSLLGDVFGADHNVTTMFAEEVSPKSPAAFSVEQGRGVLRSALDLINSGWLDTIEGIVSAEVFSDFLDMADHLISQEYIHPAASLTGAVLEDGLRRIAKKHSVPVNPKAGLDELNKALTKATVYNALVFKSVDAWRELRNSADHGRFGDYTKVQVTAMHSGVRQFLEGHL